MIQEILTEDVQEFVPYVFQILSLLLEYHNPGNITGKFNQEPHYFKKFEFSCQKKVCIFRHLNRNGILLP